MCAEAGAIHHNPQELQGSFQSQRPRPKYYLRDEWSQSQWQWHRSARVCVCTTRAHATFLLHHRLVNTALLFRRMPSNWMPDDHYHHNPPPSMPIAVVAHTPGGHLAWPSHRRPTDSAESPPRVPFRGTDPPHTPAGPSGSMCGTMHGSDGRFPAGLAPGHDKGPPPHPTTCVASSCPTLRTPSVDKDKTPTSRRVACHLHPKSPDVFSSDRKGGAPAGLPRIRSTERAADRRAAEAELS
jgi:hypothetical protein